LFGVREKIIYSDDVEKMECYYCHHLHESNAKCIDGHYICDICHSAPAIDIIQKYCITTDLTDPLEIAIILMKHPSLKMHGPEHHYLVPAVLLTAYYNQKQDNPQKRAKLEKASKRAKNVLGGFCGYYGTCGAAVGTGIFISLITDATPLSKEEWKLSNLMTSKSLATIADNGGPRCCKRNTFLAIREANSFLIDHFGVELELNENLICEFNSMNNECKKNDCIFYSK
jgi:hypothetical protein